MPGDVRRGERRVSWYASRGARETQEMRDSEFYDRLGVQLAEARRMALDGGVPRARLALLLIDNAAETILRSIAEDRLQWANMYGNLLDRYEKVARSDDPETQRRIREISANSVSVKRRKEIRRYFDPLVDYVAERSDGKFPEPLADALKVLHRYRNAAYHHDRVLPDVILPAVRIYFYLVFVLLRQRMTAMVMLLPDEMPEGVREIWDGDLPTAPVLDIGAHIATRLEQDLRVEPVDIASALSEHLLGRLSSLLLSIEEIVKRFGWWEVLGDMPGRALGLKLLQVPEQEFRDDITLEEIIAREMPISMSTFVQWWSQATSIATLDDPLSALVMFAGIDEAIAVVEEPAAEFLDQLDRESDLEAEIARGK